MDQLFDKVFRNKFLNRKIFKFIKSKNKELLYVRYNYYEIPFEVIIKTRNETLLIERLNGYIKLQEKLKQQEEEEKEGGKSNININFVEDIYKYQIDFNIKTFKSLLTWKDLKIEIFKRIFMTFKSNINSFQDNGCNRYNIAQSSYEIIVFDNGSNVELLDFMLKNYIIPNSEKNIYFNNLFENPTNSNISKLSKNMTIEMFNYLIYNNHVKDKFNIMIEPIFRFLKYFEVSDDGKNRDVYHTFFKMLPSSVFKGDTIYYENQLSEIVNKSISMNDLELFKLIISSYQIGFFDYEVQELYGCKLSMKTLKKLNIQPNSFNSNDDKFLPLFKILWDNGLFKNPFSTKTIIISPVYFEYVMELLEKNKDQVNQPTFTYKCISSTDPILFQNDRMAYDYYKCKQLNDDLQLFGIYLSKFQFDKKRLLEAVGLGYENMVTYLFQDIESNIIQADLYTPFDGYKIYIDLLELSLPSNNHNGYQYLFNLVLPIINKMGVLNIVPSYTFSKINYQKLPLDPAKREQYILNIQRIYEFNQLKNTYFSKLYHSNFNSTVTYFVSIKSERNSFELMNTVPSESTEINLYVINYAFKISNFKLIKKYFKAGKPYRLNTIFNYISDSGGIKSLFYLILNAVKFNIAVSLFITELAKFSSKYCNLNNSKWFDLSLGLNQYSQFKLFNSLSVCYGNTLDTLLSSLDSNSNNDRLINADKLLVLFQIKFMPFISKKDAVGLVNIHHTRSIEQQLKYSQHNSINFHFILNLFAKSKKEIQENNLFNELGIYDIINEPRSNKSQLFELFGLTSFYNSTNNISNNIIEFNNKLNFK